MSGMPKSLPLLICLAVALAGCTNTPPAWKEKPPKPTPAPKATNIVATPVVAPRTNMPATNPPPTPVVAPPALPRTNEFPELWVSVNRWAQLRNLGPVRRVSIRDGVAFDVQTTNGTVVLQADSDTAYWNDVQLRLGFAPQIVGGQLYVHRLDLIKNLEPLLRLPVMTKTNRLIVIDAGHGGANSGTGSVLGDQWEKQFTLDWALRLAPLLEANGWQVLMTRTNDIDVSLAERVAFTAAHHADLFISLHFNSAAPDEREAGLETYCLTPTGMESTLTRDYSDDVKQVFPNNAFDTANWAWAYRVHRGLLETGLFKDRGLRHARFMGALRGQRQPAMLVEGGYLSNPAEARRISDPEFRQKLAEAIAAALP